MLDKRRAGFRVRAERLINGYAGSVAPKTMGTVVYEIAADANNAHQFVIEWDTGSRTNALEKDILLFPPSCES